MAAIDPVASSHARWLGGESIVAHADRDDIDGLAELGRTRLAKLDVAGAQCAFEAAVARAESRANMHGEWQLPSYVRGRVDTIAFTPDGRWFVVLDDAGRVEVWDAVAMRAARSFQTASYSREVAISRTGAGSRR